MKNLILSLAFAMVSICSYSQIDTTGESYELFINYDNSLRGFKDKSGQIVIPSIYESNGFEGSKGKFIFFKGRAIMRKQTPNGYLYGLINYKNDIIIPFKYDNIVRIADNYYCEISTYLKTKQELKEYYKMNFVNGDGWVMFNRNGKLFFNKLLKEASSVSCENYSITTSDNEKIYLSSNGKILYSKIKTSYPDFNSSIRIITLNNKYGLLDSCLSLILDSKYENIVVLNNIGYVVLEIKPKSANSTSIYRTSVLNKYLEIIKEFGDSIKDISSLYTLKTEIDNNKLEYLFTYKIGNKWGVMNMNGDIIIPAKYEGFEYTHDFIEAKYYCGLDWPCRVNFTLDGKEIK